MKGGIFLQSELNLIMEEYLKLSISEITYSSILKTFKKVKNWQGRLLHSVLDSQTEQDQEKVLKIIQLLFENGCNVNYCNILGHNFIQAALKYGIKCGNERISCSTEFVVDLILLGKKFNLNVNARDREGNSIIHTAISSEIYRGEILPILDALGDSYNIYCINKKGKDLITTFNMCKNLANEEDDDWYNRLVIEENAFRKTIQKRQKESNVKLEKKIVKKQVRHENDRQVVDLSSDLSVRNFNSQLILEIEKISSQLNFTFFKANAEYLLQLKQKIMILGNDQNLSLEMKKHIFYTWKNFEDLLQNILDKEISFLADSHDMITLKSLIVLLDMFDFIVQRDRVIKIIEEYQNLLKKKVVQEIEFNLTIENQDKIAQMIDLLKEKDRIILEKNFLSRKEQLENLISVINELMLVSDSLGIHFSLKEQTLFSCNIIKLNEIKSHLEKEITNRKKGLFARQEAKLHQSLKEILALSELGVFKEDELWNMIQISVLNYRKNGGKINKGSQEVKKKTRIKK